MRGDRGLDPRACRLRASDASVTLTGVTLLDDATRARAATAPGGRRPPSWVLVAGAVTVAFGIGLFFYSRSDMWLDEALTVNIARLPLGDLRGALRARRCAAALLRPAAHLDGCVRRQRRRGAIAVGRVRARGGDHVLVRGAPLVRRADGLAHGHRARDQSVPHPLRDRSAHVHARDPPRRAGHHRGAACAGATDARPVGVRQPRHRRARVHAVLGVLPRRDRRGDDAARRVAATRRGAASTSWSPARSQSGCCCSFPGCRRSCRSARTPVRRGASRCSPDSRSG